MNNLFTDSIKPIYIIGNSRSGTTLMANILKKNNDIFVFKELHFFEQHYSSKDKNKVLNRNTAIELVSKLIKRSNFGLFYSQERFEYLPEAKTILDNLDDNQLTPLNVYENFLRHTTHQYNCIYPCEQTPRYIFFIKTIKKQMPHAKFIYMVRDPRAVLLSQKNKWRIRKYGKKMPKSEALRLWFNYHPILISIIWNKVEKAISKFNDSAMVKIVKFEDLIQNPEQTLRNVCNFLGISFSDDMLKVNQIGSSNIESNNVISGFNSDVNYLWEKRLRNIEVFWCQNINKKFMAKRNYKLAKVKASLFSKSISIIILFIKAPFIFYLNSKRFKNPLDAIKKLI